MKMKDEENASVKQTALPDEEKPMMTDENRGYTPAPKTFYIKIVAGGPYLVFGNPPLDIQTIVPNADGQSWTYRDGRHINVSAESPSYSLCRCGHTHNAPFCDGTHHKIDWDSGEHATFEPIMNHVKVYNGPRDILFDNERYCAYARFCDACGRVWNLVRETHHEEGRKLFEREVAHCPSGRLIAWDREKKVFLEPDFSPSISLIEDPAIQVSGPIWVKGGIRIYSSDGKSYEVRNRVTLCRCGLSGNKPFCDGTHASSGYTDELEQ